MMSSSVEEARRCEVDARGEGGSTAGTDWRRVETMAQNHELLTRESVYYVALQRFPDRCTYLTSRASRVMDS